MLEIVTVLVSVSVSAEQWARQVSGIETRYWRAVGDVLWLVAKARELGRHWLKGAGVPAWFPAGIRFWFPRRGSSG